MNSEMRFLAVFLFAFGFIALTGYAKYRWARRTIVRNIQSRGGVVKSIQFQMGWIISEWYVEYEDEDGVCQSRWCRVGPGWGQYVYWRD